MKRIVFSVMMACMLLVTACAPSAAPSSAPVNSGQPAALSARDWQMLAFTDVRTGKPIKLSDYTGKTVIVEAMAAWCTNCLAQQRRSLDALAQLKDQSSVVYISLGVDLTEDAPLLAKYTQQNGFPWTFGIANQELLNALIKDFGRSITSPSSVPLFTVSPSGKISQLYLGAHSAEEMVKLIADTSNS